ncbi:hypothetical protein GIB67_009960, partial [Kingdonia uniflora]
MRSKEKKLKSFGTEREIPLFLQDELWHTEKPSVSESERYNENPGLFILGEEEVLREKERERE